MLWVRALRRLRPHSAPRDCRVPLSTPPFVFLSSSRVSECDLYCWNRRTTKRQSSFRPLRLQFRAFATDEAERRETVDSDPGRYRLATVPNALCLARIVMTPCIGAAVVQGATTPAFVMFVIAGFTDLVGFCLVRTIAQLDGQIARRVPGQQSLLGSVLDPVADKLLVSTLFVTLSYTEQLPLLLTAIVITRDVCLIVGGFVKRYYQLKKVPPITLSRFFDPSVSSMRIVPSLISKVNTVLQLTVVAFALSLPVLDFGSQGQMALDGMCWMTALTTIWSGLQYASGKAFQPVS